MKFKRDDQFKVLSGRISTLASAAAIVAVSLLLCQSPAQAEANTGKAKFEEHCAVCHANGGNIVKADKTLMRKDREKYGVKTAKGIVNTMRNPGVGMPPFDKKTLSDKDAEAIADYILKTFK